MRICIEYAPVLHHDLKGSKTFMRKTHGQSNSKDYAGTAEYRAWAGMKSRCYNKKRGDYERYGGRGIKVCERWSGKNGFINFLSDMGRKPTQDHSLDRYPDNNGHYEPSNCRWATRSEQGINKRNNHMLTLNGKTQTIAQWSKELGILEKTIDSRIVYGWCDKDVLTRPVRSWGRSIRLMRKFGLAAQPRLQS